MRKLTGTLEGDTANNLHAFYRDQAQQLESSGHYFISAVALALAVRIRAPCLPRRRVWRR